MDVVLAGVDLEHLRSALVEGLGTRERPVSFGTNAWPEPTTFPADIPIYIYGVTRGSEPSIPAATFRGTFREYRAAESFGLAELDATRPATTLARRDPTLPEEQQEPWWAGYLMVSDLEGLERPVPLSRFRIGGKAASLTVVRRPLLASLP